MEARLLLLPDWLAESPELFRKLAGRVERFERRPHAAFGYDTVTPLCSHGYNPFTDSCPGCDSDDE